MGRPHAQDRVEPLCRLVRFKTADDLTLAGLLFEPKRRSTRAAIFLHGMGGSFEPPRTNILGARFADAGIAYFAFNNRGSYLIRRRGPKRGGMAYEKIRDCVIDIDAAVREVRSRGYRDLTLIGHSTGANKIAVYDHRKPRNFIKRYILLGPGDDTGIAYAHLGPRRFRSTLEKAKAMIRDGRGEELMPESLAPTPPLSWIAFYDIANPDGDYNVFPFLELLRGLRLGRKPRFRHLRAIRKPTLALWGANDEYCFDDVSGCIRVTAEAIGAKSNFELATLADADHGFGGREDELAEVILRWME
ncbi:MAG TPA: alpha/beta fold hydrolase [Thermoanaerobaculia bacterium]|nr:alpha/beta fold hydrolase [Thermoanaerobaculia bacterium]